jgi:hypothetical protein
MDFPRRCPSQDVQYSLSNENLSLLGEDVGVTLVKDGHGGAAEERISTIAYIISRRKQNVPEEFTAGSSKFNLRGYLSVKKLSRIPSSQDKGDPFSEQNPLSKVSSSYIRNDRETSSLSNGDCLRSRQPVVGISGSKFAGKEFSTHVVTAVVVDRGLGEHSVVFFNCQFMPEFDFIFCFWVAYTQAQTCGEAGSFQRSGSVQTVKTLSFSKHRNIPVTNQLGLARSERLESGLLAHGDLSTLHDESQTARDGVTGFLSLHMELETRKKYIFLNSE